MMYCWGYKFAKNVPSSRLLVINNDEKIISFFETMQKS